MVRQEARSAGSSSGSSLWKILNTPIWQLWGGARPMTGANGKEKAKEMVRQGQIAHGIKTLYAVNGIDFAVQPETWIFGEVEYGAMAKYPVCFGRVLVCLESAKKWKIKN